MNMKKMTSILPIKSLSVFIVLQSVFSGGIAAAADNKNLTPILHLLLADKNVVPATVCDDSHLSLCATSSTCTNVGGYWWNNNTCNSTEEPPQCDDSNLDLCLTSSTCTDAGGYWWNNNTCNSSQDPGTVTSAGQVWMDRNLGASQVATSSTDSAAYGDLYQWGRGADGHQLRTSPATATTSATDAPGHGSFITTNTSPLDWRVPQNNSLWQGVSGTNNPCPAGFRLPTATELDTERASWASNNSAGAFLSPLKLVVAGYRDHSGGTLGFAGSGGFYWSSTVGGSDARSLDFGSGNAYMGSFNRAYGFSLRCLKD